ncbi:hypothetical protein PC9H_004332 [Pleurotus ostreatus]|uniref:Uncharacterized protein n=1 Tax=Pleurotus ostreatus TaxID=5322 RepID=A0A8H7A445_PLEOS|nr:uncharacterized protein PC9H_004332 [Pleurotus ostreatus]KAF7437491.1 hypothetical protein PC9H_004332 [Pleurotus ostreatus]KAJ8703435.1 hypothetical protein PTI98_002057 [Pleurotus ostreatus]
MPHPRIYHTKANRRAANCAKSARHYAKNKADILAKRRDIRAHREDPMPHPRPEQHAEPHLSGLPQSSPTTEAVSHDADVSQTISLAYCTARKLSSFINHSPAAFANSTFIKYVKVYETGTNDIGIIKAPLERLQKWQRRLDKCGEVVLEECGMGRELQMINGAGKMAGTAIEYLEELLCDAMLDPVAMQAAYKRHRYNYQLV